MEWLGKILAIHISRSGGDPMVLLKEAELLEGYGIKGDRYANGSGTYSNLPSPDRQITLIEIEVLDAIKRDYQIQLLPKETRRNITTQGVPLNHLVNKRFWLGKVLLEGSRLNVPCMYLERVTGKKVYKPLVHRSGLNCKILKSGLISAGDPIKPA